MMTVNPYLQLLVALLGSAAMAALINGLFARRNKKRDEEMRHVDGRVDDAKAQAKKNEDEIRELKQELKTVRGELSALLRDFASLGRDYASLDQYATSLEMTARRLDPGVQLPPRPHRERRDNG